MLVSNLIEYNYFCQICFSSVNTVIICFISEVSLRFPFKRFFSRPALDIHPVSSSWVLLHMIPWVLSSVTCKLPLVLVIIFLSRDISCLWLYLLKHVYFSPVCGIRHDNISFMTVDDFFMKPHLSTSSFSLWLFFICHLCHFIMTIHLLSTSSFSSWQYIRCQHSLIVDHWWCFHIHFVWTPSGSRIP